MRYVCVCLQALEAKTGRQTARGAGRETNEGQGEGETSTAGALVTAGGCAKEVCGWKNADAEGAWGVFYNRLVRAAPSWLWPSLGVNYCCRFVAAAT